VRGGDKSLDVQWGVRKGKRRSSPARRLDLRDQGGGKRLRAHCEGKTSRFCSPELEGKREKRKGLDRGKKKKAKGSRSKGGEGVGATGGGGAQRVLLKPFKKRRKKKSFS